MRGRLPAPSLVALFSLAAAASVALAPSHAQACSCLPPPPPAEALEAAQAVFEAKAVSVGSLGRNKVFSFEVRRVFKGDVPQTVRVVTAPDSAMCGREYGIGESYLLYARDHEDDPTLLSDNLCSRTQPIARAKEDLAVLGKGTSPSANAPETETPEPTQPTEPETTAPDPGEPRPAPEQPVRDPSSDRPRSAPQPAAPPPVANERGCSLAATTPWGLLGFVGVWAAHRRKRVK